jgi:phosphoenolpyruvate carboxykinase (ATP)
LSNIYDTKVYDQFADNLKTSLKGKNIKTVKLNDLRSQAQKTGQKTVFGSYGWRSAVSSRLGPKTVYLGSPSVRLPQLSEQHEKIISNAPEELHKVLHLLRTLPFIHLRRQMGSNDEYNPVCNLYISMADPKNARLAYMWGHTMADVNPRKPGPEFTMIHIPEEHHMRQQVLAIPEHNINICLGSDYMGEDKKGFLRQGMWYADEHNMLGLHAGSKIVNVRDKHTGKLKRYGVFIFGLTATGKSTWSCHQLGLDHTKNEGTWALQDDIVFLRADGSSYGSEMGFFVKTDVDKKLQEAMYNALIHRSALYENVMIDSHGSPDFLDENLCANGRAVIQPSQLKVKLGGRMQCIMSDSINMPNLEELDGVAFAFITRRNSIMSFAQQLTPEQGVLAYLWGESTHSFATRPEKAGESVRIVGTDDFIIGSRARKVNRFRNIVFDMMEKYPGKVHFLQYNTGGVGEIIEKKKVDGKIQKTLVRKVQRTPLDLMAALQRGDLRGTNKYEVGILGTPRVVECEDFNLKQYDPHSLYNQEQIDDFIQDLVDGRKKFTEEIASEGLDPKIKSWAEESFSIAPKNKSRVSVPADVPSKEADIPDTKEEAKKALDEWPAEFEITLPDSMKLRPPRMVTSRFR